MSETNEEYSDYRPEHGNHQNSRNDSILYKSNIQYDSLAGNAFSNSKTPMTTIITDPALLVGNSLKLSGYIKLLKTAALVGAVKFHGSAYSLIKSLQIYYGGTPFVNLTQYVKYLAQFRRNITKSHTEYEQSSLTGLEGQDLNATPGARYNFELDLDIFGLVKKFMPTSDLAKMEIKIVFESELGELFNCAVNTAGQTVTGYELSDCYINADTITYKGSIHQKIMNEFRSAKGVEMASHSFQCSSQDLVANTLSHNLRASANFMNLTNGYVIPIPQTVVTNASGCSPVDIVATASYANKDYPSNEIIKLGNNGRPVQPGSFVGATKKLTHYNGVLSNASATSKHTNVAAQLTKLYKTDDYQCTSGSWVKGLLNDERILNNGENTNPANGLVLVSFNTASNQAGKSALVVFEYTSVIKVSQGQIMLIE